MTAVIAQHCKILPCGWIGVWLFFVISGFVVTTSVLNQPSEAKPASFLGRFYARRAARIWPIYFGYALIGFVVSGLAAGSFETPTLASLLGFYNNFQAVFANGNYAAFPVGHLWTISVEMQFYAVFGIAFALLSRRMLSLAAISCLLLAPLLRWAASAALISAGFKPLDAAFAIYALSPLHFDSFAAGVLLALGAGFWDRGRRPAALLAAGMTATLVYAGAYVAVNISHGAHGLGALRNVISGILFGDMRQVWLYSAIAMLCSGVLAVSLTGGRGGRIWAGVVNNRALQAIGRVSYGGYVYHILALTWTRRLLGLWFHPGSRLIDKVEFGAVLFPLTMIATIALASASYAYLEQPIIRAVSRRLKAHAAG